MKMARAALGWSGRELARRAEIAPNTIARFEIGYDALFETVKRIQATLEKGGVIFIQRDTNGGPGVRLKR